MSHSLVGRGEGRSPDHWTSLNGKAQPILTKGGKAESNPTIFLVAARSGAVSVLKINAAGGHTKPLSGFCREERLNCQQLAASIFRADKEGTEVTQRTASRLKHDLISHDANSSKGCFVEFFPARINRDHAPAQLVRRSLSE